MSSHPPCVPSRGMAGCRSQLGSSDPKPSAPELRWCLVSMLWPGFLVLAARPAANPPGQKDKHRRKPKGMQNPRGPGNVPMWQWAASCATYGCHMAAWLLGASATSSLLGGGFVSRVLRRSRQEFQHHRRFPCPEPSEWGPGRAKMSEGCPHPRCHEADAHCGSLFISTAVLLLEQSASFVIQTTTP